MTYTERERRLVADAVKTYGTQSELARAMRVPRQQVHRWVSGEGRLTGENLIKIWDLIRRRSPEYTFSDLAVAILQKMVNNIVQFPQQHTASA